MIGKSFFAFNVSPRIRFGLGATSTSQNIDEIINCLGTKIMVVTDKGLTNLRLYESMLSLIEPKVNIIIVFDDIEPDPSIASLVKAIKLGTEKSITGVLGFGGGSSMDVAKLVSLIIGSGESIDDIWGVENVKGPRLPLCLVPTTAGTGSEVTPVSIISIKNNEKRGVVSQIILPDYAILDPYLTLGLPRSTTAATGVDAMVHAIEAFTSKNSNNNYISKFMAKEALVLLSRSIRSAVKVCSELNSRSEMLLGSALAGIAFANSPVAAVHALAYPLGGTFKVPHGLSNSLVLPEILKFNSNVQETADAYAELSKLVFPNLPTTGSTRKDALRFALHLKDLASELGLPVRLRDVNIPEQACEQLAKDAMKQTRLLVNNPREVLESDALTIYRNSW